jgi:hypothetical protein
LFARLPADHRDLHLAVAGEAVFEVVRRTRHALPSTARDAPNLDHSPLRRDDDCNRNAGVPRVVHVVAIVNVIHINVVGFVPVRCPVSRPRVNHTEPIAAVLEAWEPANQFEGEAVDAESVAPTIVATEIRVRNAVAVIATSLTPSAVVGLPIACPMSLPSGTLHLLLLRRDPLLPGFHLLGRLLLLLPVLGLLLLLIPLLGLPVLLRLLLLLGVLLLLLLRSLPGLLLRLGTLLLLLFVLSLLLLLGVLLLLLFVLSLLLLLGVLLLLLLRSLPGLLLRLGTLLLGLSLLDGWGLLGRLGPLLLLLLLLCASRNCDPKNQEQK